MQTIDFDRISFLMRDLNLRQEDIGELLGITAAAVSIMKRRNNVSDRNAGMLANKLNVNMRWMETGKGEVYINGVKPDVQALLSNVSSSLQQESTDVSYWKEKAMQLENQVTNLSESVLNLTKMLQGNWSKAMANCFSTVFTRNFALVRVQNRVHSQLAPGQTGR